MSKFRIKQIKERRSDLVAKQGCLNSVKVESTEKGKSPAIKIRQVKERRSDLVAKQGCLNSVKVTK